MEPVRDEGVGGGARPRDVHEAHGATRPQARRGVAVGASIRHGLAGGSVDLCASGVRGHRQRRLFSVLGRCPYVGTAPYAAVTATSRHANGLGVNAEGGPAGLAAPQCAGRAAGRADMMADEVESGDCSDADVVS